MTKDVLCFLNELAATVAVKYSECSSVTRQRYSMKRVVTAQFM